MARARRNTIFSRRAGSRQMDSRTSTAGSTKTFRQGRVLYAECAGGTSSTGVQRRRTSGLAGPGASRLMRSTTDDDDEEEGCHECRVCGRCDYKHRGALSSHEKLCNKKTSRAETSACRCPVRETSSGTVEARRSGQGAAKSVFNACGGMFDVLARYARLAALLERHKENNNDELSYV